MNNAVGKNKKAVLEFGKEYILKVVEDDRKIIDLEKQVADLNFDVMKLENAKRELYQTLQMTCGHNNRTGWVGCGAFIKGNDGCEHAERGNCKIWEMLKKYDNRNEQEKQG